MKKTDLLVIGGSAGGVLSATTARKAYGDIDITLVRETEKVMVPCGIPYIYGTLNNTDKNVMPDTGLLDSSVHVIVDRVTQIDRSAKIVTLAGNESIEYKKLILATGSLPIIPAFIPGNDLENVFAVYKNQDYLNSLLDKLKTVQNVVVIGGGFIGVEFAEQIRLSGKNVTLIELADACLWQAFDRSFNDDIEASLTANGIRLLTGTKVKKIVGATVAEGVEVESGE